jgi:hypothetical protein
MLKHLTITFQNEDTIVIPARAIQYLNIEKITQNIAVIDQDAMPYQKAEFVELSIYEDTITNLKTAYMQEKPNVYKKTTVSERLAYPAIESIQLDDNEPITVDWAPVKTHKDYIENLYQVSEKSKDINNRPLLIIEIGKPNPERHVF